MTINKSISINATSQTAEGQPIAYFSASVSVSGSGTSSNMTIDNQDLYEANKF
jgi:fumarate hydratase class II